MRLLPGQLSRDERRLVGGRYRGSYARYRSALTRKSLTRADGLAILADGIRIRRLGHASATARLGKAVDSALCLRDELPGRELVDLTDRL